MSSIVNEKLDIEPTKPLVVGHRGFRGRFPENTLLAMRKGVEAGATVVETDIQMAKDGVIVMCHDVTTGRCFDHDYDVEETNYNGVLDQLHTKDHFREKMPTLEEVLTMFKTNPDFANVKLMIDIKRSNRPHVIPELLRVLKNSIDLERSTDKLTFGVWKTDVMEAVHKYAPDIPVTFIGWELRTAKLFMTRWPSQVKAISVSYASLATCGGPKLMECATQRGVDIYSWTVNDPDAFKWAVAARLKGVITDFPDIFSGFLKTISEKDLYSEYFQSDPRHFYSLCYMIKLYILYFIATGYLLFADNLPFLFKRL